MREKKKEKNVRKKKHVNPAPIIKRNKKIDRKRKKKKEANQASKKEKKEKKKNHTSTPRIEQKYK